MRSAREFRGRRADAAFGRRRSRSAVFVTALTLLIAAPAGAGEGRAVTSRELAMEVWRITRDNFYDPDAVKTAWDQARRDYVDTLPEHAGAERTSAAIEAMLATLDASHTGRYTPDQPAYYDLMDIGVGFGQLKRVRHLFADGEPAYVGLGLVTKTIGGRIFVAGLHENGPARAAGVLRGDELIAVDDAPFTPVEAFRHRAGQPVTLTLRRAMNAEPMALTVTPRRIRPADAYENAMRASARVIEHGGKSIGYVHVWSLADDRYRRLLIELLSSGPLAEADALVLDLRGGWGGRSRRFEELFLGGSAPVRMISRRERERAPDTGETLREIRRDVGDSVVDADRREYVIRRRDEDIVIRVRRGKLTFRHEPRPEPYRLRDAPRGHVLDRLVSRSTKQRDRPEFRWFRPVVTMIDSGSRSAKEILAYSLQARGAPVVGERTSGAVLSGKEFVLSDGSLLYVARYDVIVDGERLERAGVEPDITIEEDIRYMAGRDPRLEAALDEAARLLGAQ